MKHKRWVVRVCEKVVARCRKRRRAQEIALAVAAGTHRVCSPRSVTVEIAY
jgi:hypothetical protein